MVWTVLLGGALGALARYGLGLWVTGRFGHGFPWGTLTVNVAGSFLVGVVAVLADEHRSTGPYVRTFLIAGVLGGFTTFSSFSAETFRLWDDGRWAAAGANIAANLVLSLLAAAAGFALARGMR